MRDDAEPRARVSTVLQRQDSIGSFEDIEDFDIPQRTTKERTSDPPEDGGFEVIDHDDLGSAQ